MKQRTKTSKGKKAAPKRRLSGASGSRGVAAPITSPPPEMEPIRATSELDHRQWDANWSPALRKAWEAHGQGPCVVDRVEGADLLSASRVLGTAVHQFVTPGLELTPTPRIPAVEVHLNWFPFPDEDGVLEYRPQGRDAELRLWSRACSAPFLETMDALFGGHWPPRHAPMETNLPLLDASSVPRDVFSILSHVVDRWAQPSQLHLASALAAVQAGRCPFKDRRVTWSGVVGKSGAVRFQVPLLTFGWRMELEHLDHPVWVAVRRTFLRIEAERKGDVRTVDILCATDESGDRILEREDETLAEDEVFADRIGELAYTAYADLTEEFYKEPTLFEDDEEEPQEEGHEDRS